MSIRIHLANSRPTHEQLVSIRAVIGLVARPEFVLTREWVWLGCHTLWPHRWLLRASCLDADVDPLARFRQMLAASELLVKQPRFHHRTSVVQWSSASGSLCGFTDTMLKEAMLIQDYSVGAPRHARGAPLTGPGGSCVLLRRGGRGKALRHTSPAARQSDVCRSQSKITQKIT
jgi:hypothetical protein